MSVNLNNLWAVVWHPKGASCVLSLDILLQFNRLARRRNEPGYMVLDVVESMDKANERKREMNRGREAERGGAGVQVGNHVFVRAE